MDQLKQEFAIEQLEGIGPPFLHLFIGEQHDVGNFCGVLSVTGKVARLLRGQRMQTVEELFNEFAAAFQFPYYFGYNWPAFDECLGEIDWLPPTGYIACIMDAGSLLVQDDPAELRTLVRILGGISEEYAKPIALGEAWDRPAVPFHVILQEREEGARRLGDRLLSAGASPTRLIRAAS